MKYSAVILAAGKGVRMRSDKPKVVHRVAGKEMIKHVVDTVKKAGINNISLVVGHKKEMVQEIFSDIEVKFVIQEEQLGTGHALAQAESTVKDDDIIMVLAGDTPLLQSSTLKDLLDYHQRQQAAATVLSTEMGRPYGYGRILRNNDNSFLSIVEEKDANEEEKKIKEINSGIYCLKVAEAFAALRQINSKNTQNEYYLTDMLGILKNEGKKVEVFKTYNEEDISGINDRVQLARAEKILRKRKNDALMRAGVTIMDPDSVYIDSEVEIGIDTVIYPFTIIEGNTYIGEACEIGPGTHISSSRVGDRVFIENSRIKESSIGNNSIIGPYAYLRPGATLEKNVKIGDFVEIKKSFIGEKSKVPHLSYIGDAKVGKGVNVGAGTITCNYDGKNKYETILEDGAFIGSNTNLVAPVKIGKNAVTGAGSTINTDVPANSLGVERAKQKNIQNWTVRTKKED